MAKWISGYIPDDIETYVEVFGGAFWVYVNGDVHTRPKLQKVIYNDFNRYMVNLFECCKNPQKFYNSMVDIKAQDEELFYKFKKEVFDDNDVNDVTLGDKDFGMKYAYIVTQVFSGLNPVKGKFIDLKGKYKSKFDSFRRRLVKPEQPIQPMSKKEYWPDIVGQPIAKRKLEFHLENYNASSIIPHLMFIAPKGCGKTMMAKATGKNLELGGKPKTFIELNCSTLKSVGQFINQVIIPHVHQRDCTVLFDEASELPKDVTMALLTILNPNKENRTSFSFEEYTIDFDFRRQSFMFATTEAHRLFHALIDRCDRIDLEEYSFNELGEIVQRNLPDVDFDKGLKDKIATVLRGNARQAQKMAGNIKSFLKRSDSHKMTDKLWGDLKFALGILPLGLNRIEIQVLKILTEKKECSLTNLSAKTGLTPQCLRQDFELYLQKHNLMEITTSGRAITAKGLKYLKEFKKVRTK